MFSFLTAIQFLTIIPIKKNRFRDDNMAKSCVFFPLVGLFIGLILFILYKPLASFLSPLTCSAIIVVFLATITGGIHLDGLADTFDALAANKDKTGKLEVMRDSHIGAIGTVSLISVIILKILLLSEISDLNKFPALLSICVLSRWAQVFCIHKFNYARTKGKAEVFFTGMNSKIFILAGFIALFLSILLLQLNGLNLFILMSIFVFLLGRFFSSKFDGLTGDTIGAISELSEIFVLFVLIVLI